MSFKGISAENDARYTNAEKKLLLATKFPSEFSTKVDMSKVNIAVLLPWISHRITDLLGFEDEVVIELIMQMLAEDRFPDARKTQLALTGFLHKEAATFMKDLWDLLLSAQVSPGGMPSIIVEEKKLEISQRRQMISRISDDTPHSSSPGIKSESGTLDQGFDDFDHRVHTRQEPTRYRSRSPSRKQASAGERDYDRHHRVTENAESSTSRTDQDASRGSRTRHHTTDLGQSRHYRADRYREQHDGDTRGRTWRSSLRSDTEHRSPLRNHSRERSRSRRRGQKRVSRSPSTAKNGKDHHRRL